MPGSRVSDYAVFQCVDLHTGPIARRQIMYAAKNPCSRVGFWRSFCGVAGVESSTGIDEGAFFPCAAALAGI